MIVGEECRCASTVQVSGVLNFPRGIKKLLKKWKSERYGDANLQANAKRERGGDREFDRRDREGVTKGCLCTGVCARKNTGKKGVGTRSLPREVLFFSPR